jgi:hypothetical protein
MPPRFTSLSRSATQLVRNVVLRQVAVPRAAAGGSALESLIFGKQTRVDELRMYLGATR